MQNSKKGKGGPKAPNELTVYSPGGGKVKINIGNLKAAARVLRALNHPLRQKMLKLMSGDGPKGKEVTVTDLYNKLKIEQSVASQHLAIMRNASIVTTRRDGKFIYYSVSAQDCTTVEVVITELAKLEAK